MNGPALRGARAYSLMAAGFRAARAGRPVIASSPICVRLTRHLRLQVERVFLPALPI
jgi:hypothetical protein